MRSEGVLFNPVLYAEAYGDIAAAFGSDVLAITKHYMTAGINEKRTEGTSGVYGSMAEKKEAEEAAAAAANNSSNEDNSAPDAPSISGGNSGR